MQTTFLLKNGVYPIHVRVIFGDADFIAGVSKKYYKGADIGGLGEHEGFTQLVEFRDSHCFEVIVNLQDVAYTCSWYATLAHEAVHVATNILTRVGVPLSKDNDEAMAYIVDWFVCATLQRLRALDRKRKHV